MKSEQEIDLVLQQVKEYWLKKPGMSLCQLIGYTVDLPDILYTSDDELIEFLEDSQ